VEGLVELHNMSLCDEQKRTEKYGYDQKHVSPLFFVEETLLFSNHWNESSWMFHDAFRF
jgi:hypothetical protein